MAKKQLHKNLELGRKLFSRARIKVCIGISLNETKSKSNFKVKIFSNCGWKLIKTQSLIHQSLLLVVYLMKTEVISYNYVQKNLTEKKNPIEKSKGMKTSHPSMPNRVKAQIDKLCSALGTVHLRRRQIFMIVDPYPPTIGIPAKCL